VSYAAVPPSAPAPAAWEQVWDDIEESRSGRTASVDVFHAFLLGLRDQPHAAFQALVAVLLSVQCRDAVALQAVKRLTAALGGTLTPAAVKAASLTEVEESVSCCNYKGTKASFVKRVADEVLARFNGAVPTSVKDLESLPGVGPKSAPQRRAAAAPSHAASVSRLVASIAFPGADGASHGVVVDTHVRRVAGRLGWAGGSAEQTRVRLEAWLPESRWDDASLLLIGHGQEVCTSQRPRCADCRVRDRCPSAGAAADEP